MLAYGEVIQAISRRVLNISSHLVQSLPVGPSPWLMLAKNAHTERSPGLQSPDRESGYVRLREREVSRDWYSDVRGLHLCAKPDKAQ